MLKSKFVICLKMYWASFLALKLGFAVNKMHENAIFEDFKSYINPILLNFSNTSSRFNNGMMFLEDESKNLYDL